MSPKMTYQYKWSINTRINEKTISTSLAIRETQAKTTMRYHCTLTRKAQIFKKKKKTDKQVLERNRETGTFRHGW